jgi:hypothetical protein
MVSTIHHHDTTIPAWPDADAPPAERVIDLRDDPTATPVVERRRGAAVLHALGWLVAAAILGAVAVVAMANRDHDVAIDWLGDVDAVPMWGVHGAAAFAGFVAGRLLDLGRR